jgi:hypothetical protein
MKAKRLAAPLAALSLAALIALAASYSETLSYSISWAATWSASSAPLAYQRYGAVWSAAWSLTPMPWLSPRLGMPWAASWSLALMPCYTWSSAVPWSASWLARLSLTLPRWGGTRVSLEVDSTVNVTLPSARSWIGYANLSGAGAVDFTLPAGAKLVAFGDVVVNGSRVYVKGSGFVAEVATCMLVSVVDPRGYTYDVYAYFNGTKVAVGTSFPCVLGFPYTVAVDGGKVANVRVNGVRAYPPVAFANSSEFWITVVVANPISIGVDQITSERGAENWVVVTVAGTVRDGKWGIPISGATVFLSAAGAAQDYAITGGDGRFYLRAFARTSATSLPLEVKAYHPDYGESSLALTATVPPPAPSAAAIAGIPLWVIALAGAAAVAALLLIAYWRARSSEAAIQASEWLEG